MVLDMSAIIAAGQGNPAQLKIANCAVYALAKARSEPLLFKGGDFDRTHNSLRPRLMARTGRGAWRCLRSRIPGIIGQRK